MEGTSSLLDADLAEFAEDLKRNSFQFAILMGMNVTGKHVYAGTVPDATVAKRRAKNKVARVSRRKNRK